MKILIKTPPIWPRDGSKRRELFGFAPTSELGAPSHKGMGHIADPAGAVVVGCKVLPIFFNEHGIVDGAMKVVHRIDGKKAVARVKELLKRAAQARRRPHRATTHGKKWKKVLSFQATNEAPNKGGDEQQHEEASDDGVSCSSSKLSFKWDVGSCCSSVSSASEAALYSPLSLVSAPAKDAEQMLTPPSRKHYCVSSRLSSMSQRSASVLEGEETTCRMGQWITTDSDFVVLEL